MLRIRKADKRDLERIMEIYARAQDFMIEAGNPTQWGKVYPAVELVESDIEKGVCHVVFDEEIHGVFALFDGEDPTYKRIDGRGWLNENPYFTIHRIASDGKAHGIFDVISNYCKQLSDDVRIDTHHDNKVMQRLVKKNGFSECGIIYVDDGTPRLAYHWSRK